MTVPGEKEPGWNKLNSDQYSLLHRQLKILGKKYSCRHRHGNRTNRNPPWFRRNRNTAINSILTVYTEKEFNGLNIDFEYMGYPAGRQEKLYSLFPTSPPAVKPSTKMRSLLDVFADSAIKNRLYDLSALGKIVDQIIVMAYDFYRPGSTQSGPVHPPRKVQQHNFSSPSPCLDYDVVTSIGDINKFIQAIKSFSESFLRL